MDKPSAPTSWLRKIPEPVVTAGFLAVTLVLVYGPFLTALGFYRDDWYVLWAGKNIGPSSIITLFSIDRPVVGYVYSLTYAILGDHALSWQVYSLLLRLVGGLAFLRALRRIWPEHVGAASAAATLFLIYPGFLQQPNAMTFSNQLLGYATGLVSIAFSLEALEARSARARWLWIGSAALTGLAYMLIYEYMIGLEGMRILLLWARLRRSQPGMPKVGISSLAWAWAPYGAAIGANLVWRGLIFHSSRGATNVQAVLAVYTSDPLREGFRLVAESLKDLTEGLVFGWAVPAYSFLSSAAARPLLSSFILAALAVFLGALYVRWLNHRGSLPSESKSAARSAQQMFYVGILSTLAALLPVVAALRDLRWDSGFDRYALHMTAGIALAIVGFLWGWVHRQARLPILGFLIAVSVLTHYHNGLHWRDFWEGQRQTWWQLSWRAPQLESATVLLVDLPVDGPLEDYEIWAPANLTYSPGSAWIRISSEVLSERVLEKLQFGDREQRGMREIIGLHRDYTHALIMTMADTRSCLHVLDSRRLEVPQGADLRVRLAARYSKVSQILPDEVLSTPPASIFGPEPEHGWCYYYEEASLARQRGDWSEIVRLGEEARDQGLKPADRTEWMPFLEGYVYAGDLSRAQEIAVLIRDIEPIRHSQCDGLSEKPLPETTRAQFETMMALLCEPL